MKQLLFILALSSTTTLLQAQPWDDVASNRDQIFTRTQIAPAFDGGEKAWKKFLKKNLNNKVAKDAPAGVYTVWVQFIVHSDGSLTDVKAVTKHGYGMEQEAERVIRNTPKWIAAQQNGHDVTCYHKQLIRFEVD